MPLFIFYLRDRNDKMKRELYPRLRKTECFKCTASEAMTSLAATSTEAVAFSDPLATFE